MVPPIQWNHGLVTSMDRYVITTANFSDGCSCQPRSCAHDTKKMPKTGATTTVLIARAEILIFVYSRADAGGFSLRPREFRRLDEMVELTGVGLSLTLSEIYEGVGLV